MPGGGGAPGEADWTSDLAELIATRLRAQGLAVNVCGAWALDNSNPPMEVLVDARLFVSLHFDADVYPVRTGCFADRARNDPMAVESDRALAEWENVYPMALGIPLHNERRNQNTWNYYAFRVTSPTTPGIIIEHGVGQGLDHPILFDQIEAVADADTAAIFAYLGVVPAPPADPCEVPNKIKAQFERFIRELQPRQTPWVTATKRAAKKAGMTWVDYLIRLATGG